MAKKSDKKWKWESGVAEAFRETFSQKLPENELEALRWLFIQVVGMRREFRQACSLLREIRDELRKIKNEL
jgi:hypothetical protein